MIEGGESVVIVNGEGARTTPSVISFDKGDIKIGAAAKRVAVTNPKNTLYSVKRFIGKRYSELNKDHLNVGYEVKKGSNDTILIHANGKDYVVNVSGVSIDFYYEKYVIIVKGREQGKQKESEYFVKSPYQIKILGNAVVTPSAKKKQQQAPATPVAPVVPTNTATKGV